MIKNIIKTTALFLATTIIYIGVSLGQGLISTTETINKDMVITAHRGGAGYGNENTISCIKRSLDAGIKSIEIDVHLTSDSHIIVCHDETVDRTTNGKGKIHEMTFEQIKELRIIDENGNATEESLPELHDVLELIDGKAHLLLEIKNKNKRVGPLEHAVIDELKRYNALPWVTVQSFGDKTLETIHDIDPNIRLEKLAFFRFMGLPLIFDGGLSFFSFKKYDYIESMNLFHGGASKAFVNKLHKNNIKVRVWTVKELSKTPKADIDGIITDYPDIFIKENL